MALEKVAEETIDPARRFDFDSNFRKPDHFASGDNLCEPGKRYQIFLFEGKRLGVVFGNQAV